MEINKDMLIYDLLQAKPEAGDILMSIGMHCLGCACARGETIADAAEVHGIDVNELIEKIKNA